jgi:hypothetical protein
VKKSLSIMSTPTIQMRSGVNAAHRNAGVRLTGRQNE